MTEYWWRSWHGAPMDHKWSVIAARSGVKTGIVSAIGWALLDYASQQPNRGDVIGFDVETYAVYSGFSIEEIEAVLRAMTDKGVIKDGRLSNWEKRQPKSEKEIARATANREKKRQAAERYEMLQNVTEKYIDTDTETESDKDTETDKEKNNNSCSPEYASLCNVYEKNIGPLTPATAEMLDADLQEYGLQNCMDAISEAALNNVRKWSYIRAILKRWKVTGKTLTNPKNGAAKKVRKLVGANGEVIEEELP